jgi:hypothetical protein
MFVLMIMFVLRFMNKIRVKLGTSVQPIDKKLQNDRVRVAEK